MASTRSSPFAKMMENWYVRDELSDIPIFTKEKNIRYHIKSVDDKLKELDIPQTKRPKYLIKSLKEDIQTELRSLPEYDQNKDDYDWLCEEFIKLFHGDKTDATCYLNLLSICQKNDERLRDFLSRVRTTGYHILAHEDSKKREELLLMTFINGLQSKNAKILLKELKPKTLNDAYKIIKDEKPAADTESKTRDLFAFDNSETVSTEKLDEIFRELKELRSQVETLTEEVMQQRRANHENQWTRVSYKNQSRSRNDPKRYDNQNDRANVQFYGCGAFGHTKRFCRNKRRPNAQKFRSIEVASSDDSSEPNTDEIENSSEPVIGLSGDENPQKNQSKLRHQPVFSLQRKVQKQKKKYPDDIEMLGNYIDGKGPRPKQLKKIKFAKPPQTTISSCVSEPAANKPVIECRMTDGRKVSALFDSGAESNVIDKEFLKSISTVPENNVKFIGKSGSLQCANGSLMQIIGYAVVTLNIGTASVRTKFCVVRSIFPKIIIGMRTMSKERIVIDPYNNCLCVRGVCIPFKSKKNELAPFRRA